MTPIDPTQDGVTHINCWSKGSTELGRALSNFTHFRFKHPTFGYFASVEAFWYYIKTGMQHEQLRRLHGYTAKATGSKLPVVLLDETVFRDHIRTAIMCKIEQNPELLDQVVCNTLPLKHYYVYGVGATAVVRDQPQHYWQLEHIAQIASKWKAEPSDALE